MLLTSVSHISDLQRRIIEGKELQKGKILKKENIKGGKELQRGNRAYRDVLKWDYSSRFLVGRELEVVQAVVVQDEPPPFPAFYTPTLLPQPTCIDNKRDFNLQFSTKNMRTAQV